MIAIATEAELKSIPKYRFWIAWLLSVFALLFAFVSPTALLWEVIAWRIVVVVATRWMPVVPAVAVSDSEIYSIVV